MLDDIRGIHGVRYTWIAVRFCEVYLGGEYIYIYICTYIVGRNEDESRSIRRNNSNAR